MKNVELLKARHLEMFEQKRSEHKNIVAELYKKYISDKDAQNIDKWQLYGEFYLYFAKNFPTEIYENEAFVGTGWLWKWQRLLKDVPYPWNNGHFVPDLKGLLAQGIVGKMHEVQNSTCADAQKQGMVTALKALSLYIEKYSRAAKSVSESASAKDREDILTIANDCAFIAKNPPATFRQALQLIWFAQCFWLMEAGYAGISLGKVDAYLYPYYKSDIERGVLTYEGALELIMCFYIKLSEGDDSCMITVGGDVENELTALFIDAQTEINMSKPSITLRVSETTSDDILNKSARLALRGSGMPAYLNDTVICEGFKKLGVDDQKAIDNYANIGCYEAVPDGYFSNTVASGFNIYDSFNSFLESGYDDSDFESFLGGYKQYFDNYYKSSLLPDFRKCARGDINNISPFACAIRANASGKYFFGINILGIGVLVDSLYVIKKLVFEEGSTTVEALRLEAERNFEDTDLYNKIVSLDGHYGSNSPESNRLANDVSEFIGKTVLRHPIDNGVIASPGLFFWGQDIRLQDYNATINGRRKGELFSYGIMPSATPNKEGLTSVLMSCANISSEYFPDGCPTMITVNRIDLEKEGVLGSLLKAFFASGGAHLAVNVADGDVLRAAKANPVQYSDLLIKISGYSAKFTTLDKQMQDAVIKRSELY